MSKSDEKTESLSEKESSAELVLIAALKSSATHQETQNKATNDRIDELGGHMVKLVDKVTTLVEAGIRREESDIRTTERGERVERSQIELVAKVAEVEKQVLLLKVDYDNAKDEKEKDEKNIDTRKNNIISGLSIAFILAAIALIAPHL